MKREISFLLSLFLIVSCQEDLLNSDESALDNLDAIQTEMETVMIDEPFVFLSETDFDKWCHINEFENRVKACEIPEDQLKIMTTEALLKSILHYPLNYLYIAYDDPFEAIDIIMKYSTLHQEFVSRPDAAKTIMDSFKETTISFKENTVSKDYAVLTYVDEMFFEYFIASKHVKGFNTPELKSGLKEAIEKKIEERSDHELYSINSIVPLMLISEKECLGVKNMEYTVLRNINSSVTLYTYFGRILEGTVYSEYAPYEIVSITDCYEDHFPYATVYLPASKTYNCHFYAWEPVNPSGGNYWLERYNSRLALQLGYFWTNDLYVSCSESEAEKVYYYNGDHSAVVLSNGDYISKWGQGPVMVHAPEYGPCGYNMSYRQYYKVRTDLPLNIIQISGDTVVYPDEANDYIASLYNTPFTYVWSVRNWDNQTNTYSLHQVSSDEYQLTCLDYGVFTIRVDAYDNGQNVAYGELNVNCIPEF